ncbi:calmodulin-binding protein 60 F-like isoform X2 [Carex rostrata]
MARKRRSPPSDGAGPSRPTKSGKSTSRSAGSTSAFSEIATGSSPLELEAINCKIEGLQMAFQKMEELMKTEINELKEKLNILQNPPDTNQSESEQEDHGRYELRFMDANIGRVYTGSEVEGQENKLLQVAIYCNDSKITSGPLASAKFEVLVINRDFCASVEGGWSAETFQGSLVKARKEVGSILKDNYISQLSSGEAVLNGLIFKDNSNWATEKKWRLGIRLLESNKVRVLEAISKPFRVWDRHGKASEKLYPPLLTDGVECLKKVGKDRALALKKKKICTVKDFLQRFHINQSRLLKILGIKSELDQSWKTMIGHAKECDVGSNLYSYQKDKWKTQSMLFFDSVYNVVGAEFGNRYRSIDELKVSRKTLVNKRKKGFYKDIKKGNFIADFEMVHGQPVPIEHNFTSISTDDDAQQNDHTAGALDIQPAVNSSLSSDAVPDIGRDAHQIIVSESNHNTSESYYSTQDQTTGALNRQPAENLSQVQEQESAFVALNSTVETNSTSTPEHENMEDSLAESYQGENMEGPNEFQNIPVFTPEFYSGFEEWLDTIIVEQPRVLSLWYRALTALMVIRRLRRRSSRCMLLNSGEHYG